MNKTDKISGNSVHLQNFPKCNESLIDKNLEECMQLAQQISSMILALRRKAEKKVRQPLLKAVVPTNDEKTYKQILYIADLVKTEVNIKELEVLSPDVEMENIVKRIKPNFKTLGKRYGKLMKEIAAAFGDFDKQQISEIEKSDSYTFALPSGESVDLQADDYEIVTEDMPGWLVANEGSITVALDITVTDTLYREGVAREFVNRIQNIRKSSGYEITDKIIVKIEQNDEINSAIEEFNSYIASQVLATKLTLEKQLINPTELDFEDFKVNILVEKNIESL
jgi:isoleucyl-tRNA synthetase